MFIDSPLKKKRSTEIPNFVQRKRFEIETNKKIQPIECDQQPNLITQIHAPPPPPAKKKKVGGGGWGRTEGGGGGDDLIGRCCGRADLGESSGRC